MKGSKRNDGNSRKKENASRLKEMKRSGKFSIMPTVYRNRIEWEMEKSPVLVEILKSVVVGISLSLGVNHAL